MNTHPASPAAARVEARQAVLAWAAAEGLVVDEAAADRLVEVLAGARPVPGPRGASVSSLAAQRHRRRVRATGAR